MKRLCTIFLLAAFLVGLLPVPARAEEPPEPREGPYYLIETCIYVNPLYGNPEDLTKDLESLLNAQLDKLLDEKSQEEQKDLLSSLLNTTLEEEDLLLALLRERLKALQTASDNGPEDTTSELIGTYTKEEDTTSELIGTYTKDDDTVGEQIDTYTKDDDTVGEQINTYTKDDDTVGEQINTYAKEEDTTSEHIGTYTKDGDTLSAEMMEEGHFTTVDAAVDYLRGQMIERKEDFTFQMEGRTDTVDSLKGLISKGSDGYMQQIAEAALEHDTKAPVQGDYLRWQYGGWVASVHATYYIVGDEIDYTLDLTYKYTYYTDAVKEVAVTDHLPEVLDSLHLGEKSDYEKICAIYDYICENVTYDSPHLDIDAYKLKYTAYAALENQTSVCQGYAVLLYRMLLEAGIDCRVIAGEVSTGRHAWNIVKLGDVYYNLDATWDAGKDSYQYRLRCNANFPDHTRDDDYKTNAFNAAYPMSGSDYVYHTHTPGETVKENEVDPTCTKDGSYDLVTYCTVCSEVVNREPVSVPALGHTPGEAVKENEFDPTETTPGSYDSVVYCTVCGAELSRQTITLLLSGSVQAVYTPATGRLTLTEVSEAPDVLPTLAAAYDGDGKFLSAVFVSASGDADLGTDAVLIQVFWLNEDFRPIRASETFPAASPAA